MIVVLTDDPDKVRQHLTVSIYRLHARTGRLVTGQEFIVVTEDTAERLSGLVAEEIFVLGNVEPTLVDLARTRIRRGAAGRAI